MGGGGQKAGSLPLKRVDREIRVNIPVHFYLCDIDVL